MVSQINYPSTVIAYMKELAEQREKEDQDLRKKCRDFGINVTLEEVSTKICSFYSNITTYVPERILVKPRALNNYNVFCNNEKINKSRAPSEENGSSVLNPKTLSEKYKNLTEEEKKKLSCITADRQIERNKAPLKEKKPVPVKVVVEQLVKELESACYRYGFQIIGNLLYNTSNSKNLMADILIGDDMQDVSLVSVRTLVNRALGITVPRKRICTNDSKSGIVHPAVARSNDKIKTMRDTLKKKFCDQCETNGKNMPWNYMIKEEKYNLATSKDTNKFIVVKHWPLNDFDNATFVKPGSIHLLQNCLESIEFIPITKYKPPQ